MPNLDFQPPTPKQSRSRFLDTTIATITKKLVVNESIKSGCPRFAGQKCKCCARRKFIDSSIAHMHCFERSSKEKSGKKKKKKKRTYKHAVMCSEGAGRF